MAEELVLSAGSRHVEVRHRVDWQEQLKLLKLRFPTALTDVTATHEIPYGHLERTPDGTEEPAQAWVDVTGTLPGGPGPASPWPTTASTATTCAAARSGDRSAQPRLRLARAAASTPTASTSTSTRAGRSSACC